ncbi:pseudouridine synthase [Brachybacterium huguangmaarense]
MAPLCLRVGPGAGPARPSTAREALARRFPPLLDPAATDLDTRFARGDVVRADGTAWAADEEVAPGDELWLHREIAAEDVPEIELSVLVDDGHLLVIDKPHGMATTPRGAHILSSALVRLRRARGQDALVPLHRLDRRTAGVLALGVRPSERGAYQRLFAEGAVRKEYLAVLDVPDVPDVPDGPGVGACPDAPARPEAWRPVAGERRTLTDRLERRRGDLQTAIVAGEPNAETHVEVLAVAPGRALVRLMPRTGRTHQLRAQLAHRGTPIAGDDLYPRRREESACGDLQLLARSIAFDDPITGQPRRILSRRSLALAEGLG